MVRLEKSNQFKLEPSFIKVNLLIHVFPQLKLNLLNMRCSPIPINYDNKLIP